MTLQEERIKQGWESRRGAPLVHLPVDPPVFEGHPRVARSFSREIAHFVIRVFHNRETEFYADANDAIIRNSQFYLENKDVRDDRDSFYWNISEICRSVLRYGTLGFEEPGLVTPEAEKIFLELILLYCSENSQLTNAVCQHMVTWNIYESENHHVQRNSAIWQFLLILIKYGYGNEVLSYGGTVQEHFDAWSEFFSTWMTQRAGHSLFVEINSRVYGTETMKNLYPLYDFAPDPELRKKTGDFITLFWARWAEEQLNGNLGGGQSRMYPTSAIHTNSSSRDWAWYYTGLGEFRKPIEMDYVILDSDYRLPEIIVKLATCPEKRGTYTTETRPFGRASFQDHFPHYRFDTNWGHIYRYSYCTPNYIVGTLMCPQLTQPDWCLISTQNRYQGVVYPEHNAQLLPIPEPDEKHNLQSTLPTVGFNAFWSMQKEGTLITQRFMNPNNGPTYWSSARAAGFHCQQTSFSPMRVFFSEAGGVREHAIEKDGWFFTYCGKAWAAVKVCQGGWSWENDHYIGGQWLRCEIPGSPVIVETADESTYATFEDFQKAVLALDEPVWEDAVMKYHSLYGHDFVMVTNADSKDSTIDGEYYVKKPEISFRSPFVNGAWNGKEIKITFDGEEMLLKF